MRSCDGEGCDRPAAIRLTQVLDSESSTYYLCDACAQEKGIGADAPEGLDVAQLLATMVDIGSGGRGETLEPSAFCKMTFDDVQESGQFGCPHCYTAFESRVRRLLNRIHNARRHTGKAYLPPDPSSDEMDRRIDGLRRSLKHAVEAEEFERAAVLRDLIRDQEAAK